jgi:hypothetical protein
VDRVLDRRDLSAREAALWTLVDAGHQRDEELRRSLVLDATRHLTPDEVYLATMVISLFQFYNSFVDLNGVASLTAEGYDASGARLSTHGYAPPAETPAP